MCDLSETSLRRLMSSGMVGYTDLKESSTNIMERDNNSMIIKNELSPNNSMHSFSVFYCFLMTKKEYSI